MIHPGPDPSSPEAFDLAAYLARERESAESALARAVDRWALHLGPALGEVLRHGVMSGGKRLRPILCAAAYRASDGSGVDDLLYDLAVSLELIHSYSLMHDYLPSMDDADLRGG